MAITAHTNLRQLSRGRPAAPFQQRACEGNTELYTKATEETDSIREKTSKKDNELRKDEIRKFASPDLLQFVVEHAKELISDPGGSLVVGEILLYSDGGMLCSFFSCTYILTCL